jgi:CheY-like chemotaxis protein
MPKLLLADDSVTIQRVIELTFADEHIQVIAVGDGAQAIQRIEAEKPDVVLADVGMPERDGYEVAAHVKSSPHLAHIPVLLLTGAFEPIDEARARSVGCDGVLVKPFEPQMVINRVKDLLAGRRASTSVTAGPGAASPAPAAASSAPKRRDAPVSPETAVEPERAPQSAESLDEYFDRLDAAFSQAETQQAPARTPSAAAVEPPAPVTSAPFSQDFGDWDIAIDRNTTPPPSRAQGGVPVAKAPAVPFDRPAPAPAEGTVARPVERAVPSHAEPGETQHAAPAPRALETAPRPAESPSRGVEPPALADAFAALLAAEQGQSAATRAASGDALNDQLVEEVIRRVLERMTDQVVRQTVLPIAERLVREEIERVKKGTS